MHCIVRAFARDGPESRAGAFRLQQLDMFWAVVWVHLRPLVCVKIEIHWK